MPGLSHALAEALYIKVGCLPMLPEDNIPARTVQSKGSPSIHPPYMFEIFTTSCVCGEIYPTIFHIL
jgi:hypothetical protein